MRLGAQTGQTLTEEDAKAIGLDVPEVQAAAPSLRTGAQVVAGNSNWNTQVLGATPEFFEVREWALAEGRGFEAAELAGSGKVAIDRADHRRTSSSAVPTRSTRRSASRRCR